MADHYGDAGKLPFLRTIHVTDQNRTRHGPTQHIIDEEKDSFHKMVSTGKRSDDF